MSHGAGPSGPALLSNRNQNLLFQMFNQVDHIDFKTNPPAGSPPAGFLRAQVEGGRLVVIDDEGNEVAPKVKTGTPVNGVKATATLTSNGTAPANGVTVVIGSKTYTFQTSLTNVDGNVLIGVSAAVALDNLKSAINLSAGGGSTYAAATTAHPQFVATTNTDTTQVIEARNPGAWANGVVLTESSATLSWSGGGTGLTAGGVNTTLGKAGDELFDASYRYIATADMTTVEATGAWKRVSLGSVF